MLGDLEGMLTTHDLFDALAGDSRSQPQAVKKKPRKAGAAAMPAGTDERRIFDAGLPVDEFARMVGLRSSGWKKPAGTTHLRGSFLSE